VFISSTVNIHEPTHVDISIQSVNFYTRARVSNKHNSTVNIHEPTHVDMSDQLVDMSVQSVNFYTRARVSNKRLLSAHARVYTNKMGAKAAGDYSA
jgi:hypothetical protein